jgi:cobalt-zinc-cadmium efflux system outer membrane protein
MTSLIRLCRGVAVATALATGLVSPPSRADDTVVPKSVELPAVLTLDQALEIFHARSLDVLIAEASVMSAEGDVSIAGAVYNPNVSLGYGRVLNYNTNLACASTTPGAPPLPGCSANQYSAGISDSAAIMDVLSGKRSLRLQVARAALLSAKLSRIDAERTIGFQVKSAYIQVVEAQRSLGFTKEVAEANQKTLDLNKLRYPQVIDEGALARILTQKLEADQQVEIAEQALRQARLALAFLLGVRGKVPDFDVEGDKLTFKTPPRLENATEESLLRAAIENRPDLKSIAYQKSRAEASIALAKRQRFPDITASVDYTQTGTASNAIQPPTISFGLSAPIPIFYQMQGEIRKAQADYNIQALTYAKTTAQVISDVSTGYASFVSSKRLVERMETGGLIDSAKKARDVVQVQFKAGSATLMDFLDAQRTYIATMVEYLGDLTNYWTAVYDLEQAVGVELRQ